MMLNFACSRSDHAQFIHNEESKSVEIEVIDNEIMGCGASISFNKKDDENRRYVFVENMDEEPFMKMNGKIVFPKYVRTISSQGDSKIGDKSIEVYTINGDVKMEVEWTITWLCPKNDESCEVTYYDVVMTLTQHSSKKIYKLFGRVGC